MLGGSWGINLCASREADQENMVRSPSLVVWERVKVSLQIRRTKGNVFCLPPFLCWSVFDALGKITWEGWVLLSQLLPLAGLLAGRKNCIKRSGIVQFGCLKPG